MTRQNCAAPRWLGLLATGLLAANCGRAEPVTVTIRGHAVNDWGYQLTAPDDELIDLVELGDTPFDLLVIDYSGDGTADHEFPGDRIAALKASPGGPKVVLAYMSIGEAEDYRFYWRKEWVRRRKPTAKAPPWLAGGNPDWPGNYKVHYWDPGWQSVLRGVPEGAEKSYLDRIIDAGFDGVYLDIIDGYEYFTGKRNPFGSRREPARRMAALVEELARYAREARGQPDFIVCPQNGAEILEELSAAERQAYLDAIDCIGAEDTFFYGDRDENNPYRPQRSVIRALQRLRRAGKPVLLVDYVTRRPKVDRFYREAERNGFVPYAGVRELDRIVISPGHAPD
jgi:cysteinyl-tRNA synthetase